MIRLYFNNMSDFSMKRTDDINVVKQLLSSYIVDTIISKGWSQEETIENLGHPYDCIYEDLKLNPECINLDDLFGVLMSLNDFSISIYERGKRD